MTQGFIDESSHLDASLDSLIQHKANVRREAGLQPVRQFRLNETGGVTQPVHAQLLFLVGAHHGDEDLGVLQVSGDLGSGNRHSLDPRIAQLEQDGLTGHLTDNFGNTG